MGSERHTKSEAGRAVRKRLLRDTFEYGNPAVRNRKEAGMGERCTAVVVAAGRGSRMHSETQKQFLKLGDYPVLYYSLKCLEESDLVQSVVLVVSQDMLAYCREEIAGRHGFRKIAAFVPGGKERYDSVYAGLCACPDCDFVMIHDGARPFLTQEILKNSLEAVKQTGAAVTAVPVKDTIKLSDDNGLVKETPDRSRLWIVQTPQTFRYDLIRSAYDSFREKEKTGVTDDAMVVEQETGAKVMLSQGSYENIKITTPEDLYIAEAFLTI